MVPRHICLGFTKQQPNIATRSSHQTSLPSHVFDYVVMNQHTCLLMKHRDSSNLCMLHRTTNNVCCNCTCLTGMLGTVALEQQVCPFKLHPASVPVCSSCTKSSAQSLLPQGQQTYLTLRMFDYVAQDQHTCLKPSVFFCNKSREQQAYCSAQVSLNSAIEQQACWLQLHSTSMHLTSIYV